MSQELFSKLASEAIAVQDACNLSGVVHAFSRAMTALCEAGLDTQARNTHPIAILYSSKIASLTGSEQDALTTFGRAYDWARAEAAKANPG